MEALRSDEFKTFIPKKDSEVDSMDLQKMMLSIVQNHNFSVKEFWEMPLNLVMELLGMFTMPAKKEMSRKTLLDNERYWNNINGI